MRPVLGLALGAGGARGWCHIGVIRSLARLGLEPALVAGTSMGALVGAAWAGGRLDALEAFARGLTQRGVMQRFDLRMSAGGLINGAAVGRIVAEIGLPERIEDLAKPFAAVATDLASGREIWLREGSLSEAVRASVALPGVFSPQLSEGRWLLDGGLVNPVPVSLARAMGATEVVAVDPNARPAGSFWEPAPQGVALLDGQVGNALAALLPAAPRRLAELLQRGPSAPSYLEVVTISLSIMTEHIRRARLAGDPPHVLLSADLSDMMVLELHRAERAIAEGERITEAHRPALEALARR